MGRKGNQIKSKQQAYRQSVVAGTQFFFLQLQNRKRGSDTAGGKFATSFAAAKTGNNSVIAKLTLSLQNYFTFMKQHK